MVLDIFRTVASECGVRPSKKLDAGHPNGMEFAVPGRVIVINADNSGGVAHLVRYWHSLAQSKQSKSPTLTLFYVFLGRSPGQCSSWRLQWDFLLEQMARVMGDRLDAHFATCYPGTPVDCHEEVPAHVRQECQEQLQAQDCLDTFRSLLLSTNPDRVIVA